MWYTASRLGIDASQTCFAPDQADAVDITGRVFARLLQAHALSPAARHRLEPIALPYLRLVQADSTLFDLPEHPMQRLLAYLASLWDANDEASDANRRLAALADAAARSLADMQAPDVAGIEAALTTLEAALEPYCDHARDAEHAVRMTSQTRGRMQQSRRQADRQVEALLRAHRLLPSVAAFLSDQWRQRLIRSRPDAGTDGEGMPALLQLGRDLVALDAESASGHGRSVAAQLLKMEPSLRECCLASGMPDSDVDRLLSAMVAEFASPDTRRETHRLPHVREVLDPGDPILPVGTVFVLQQDEGRFMRLKVVWHDPDTGSHALVDRHGQRHTRGVDVERQDAPRQAGWEQAADRQIQDDGAAHDQISPPQAG